MTSGGLVAAVAIATAGLTAVGIFFGIPTWRLQRHALRQQTSNEEFARQQQVVARVLAGDRAEEPRSPENPSILDALKNLSSLMAEVAEIQAVQGWHMSDGHGPDMTEVFRHLRHMRRPYDGP
jgi:hypothetical protein